METLTEFKNEASEPVIHEHSPHRRKLITAVTLLVVVSGIAYFIYNTGVLTNPLGNIFQLVSDEQEAEAAHDYIIPGVPYFGAHNMRGSASLLNNEFDASLMSIFEYWQPDQNSFAFLAEKMSTDLSQLVATATDDTFVTYTLYDLEYTLPQLAKFAGLWSLYDARVELLKLEDLDQYINADVRTPLYTYLYLDGSEDTPPYVVPYILIGIEESSGTLVFHNYWLGNNYEVSYEEFGRLSTNDPFVNGHPFLVVQPAGLGEEPEITPPAYDAIEYPEHTEVMQTSENIMKEFGYIIFALRYGDEERLAGMLEDIFEHPEYALLPKPYRIATLFFYAETLLYFGETDDALAYALQAVAENVALDQSDGDWPGTEFIDNNEGRFGEMVAPHRILGDIYADREEWELAKRAYESALEIYDTDPLSLEGLEFVNEQLQI